jgi:hypothetical protein
LASVLEPLYDYSWRTLLAAGRVNLDGTAVADAASHHNGLFASGERVEGGCNAHALRKFAEARASEPEIAGEGVQWLQAVYDREAAARERGLSGIELSRFRREHIRPLYDQFRRWLELRVHETIPGTPEYKAIRYTLRHWDALTRFVDDPTLPIDNNLAERLLKAVALGRKNFTSPVRKSVPSAPPCSTP